MSADNPPKDRPIKEMTDREIAEETLYWLRFAGQQLSMIQSMGLGGMMKMMMGGKSG